MVTRQDLLNYILSLDKSFKTSYEITQEVQKAIKHRDEVSLKELMDMDTTTLYAINYYVYWPLYNHPFFILELELLLFHQERMIFQLFNFYLAPA